VEGNLLKFTLRTGEIDIGGVILLQRDSSIPGDGAARKGEISGLLKECLENELRSLDQRRHIIVLEKAEWA
jgi:hypothetical protein